MKSKTNYLLNWI